MADARAVPLRTAMVAALREAMQEPGFGYIDFTIRDDDARVADELGWIVDAILPTVEAAVRKRLADSSTPISTGLPGQPRGRAVADMVTIELTCDTCGTKLVVQLAATAIHTEFAVGCGGIGPSGAQHWLEGGWFEPRRGPLPHGEHFRVPGATWNALDDPPTGGIDG